MKKLIFTVVFSVLFIFAPKVGAKQTLDLYSYKNDQVKAMLNKSSMCLGVYGAEINILEFVIDKKIAKLSPDLVLSMKTFSSNRNSFLAVSKQIQDYLSSKGMNTKRLQENSFQTASDTLDSFELEIENYLKQQQFKKATASQLLLNSASNMCAQWYRNLKRTQEYNVNY